MHSAIVPRPKRSEPNQPVDVKVVERDPRSPRNRIRSRLRLQPLPKLEKAPEAGRAASPAALIVVTGPPLSGKAALGHYLSEYLPDSVHISQTDPVLADLQDEDPEPLNALLREVRQELRCGRKVVFSGRLASTHQRQRVLDVAREVSVPGLMVEVEGTDPAALERATKIADTLTELQDMLHELKELLPEYLSSRGGEHVSVPTLAVPAVEPVEEQVKAVLDGWKRLGAIR